jgi:hypothetical protein
VATTAGTREQRMPSSRCSFACLGARARVWRAGRELDRPPSAKYLVSFRWAAAGLGYL